MESYDHRSRRNRVNIIAQVLDEAKNGISKTKLASNCALNFNLLEKYIEFLEHRNLLRAVHGERNLLYKTTTEGLYALDAVKIAEKIIAIKIDDSELMDTQSVAQAWNQDLVRRPQLIYGELSVLVPFELIKRMCTYYREGMCQYEIPRQACEARICPLLKVPQAAVVGNEAVY